DSTDEPSQPDPTVRPEQSEPTVRSKKSKSSVLPEQSESQFTMQERVTPKEKLLPDSPVELEGWVRLWEKPNAIPPADVSWIKEDTERGLFTPVQTYKDITGLRKKRRVRHICDVSSWYTMLTEVLCCGPCTKAARSGEGSTVGRWLASITADSICTQINLHILTVTLFTDVDKSVVRLLHDRTEGNTMVNVWRQIQENHFEEYLHHKGLYTTLMSLVEPRGIVSAMGHRFQAPPPPRELPSARLLRHAFLLAEANNVEDYRSQILSVFGTVLKMDSTKKGRTAVETMFQPWVDNGMVVCLDIFHWIHRFDAAIRTESHSKYAAFMSALAGAVLAYNRADLELLVKALKHHVWRVTLGAQETFRLIHLAVEELKGPAGLDESGVSLFKTAEAIDEVWAGQQRHLECIQDPPDMNMYRVARSTTINNVDVPYYKCLRGSNSLERFHKTLPNMIPGTQLQSSLCRSALSGLPDKRYRTVERGQVLRCSVWWKRTAPQGAARAGVLFSQSTGKSGSFSLQDLVNDGPGPEEEVVQPGHPDTGEADEAYHSDVETRDDVLDVAPSHITLTSQDTSTVHPPAFEDACSPNPLPGFEKLGTFCSLLVRIGLAQDKLSLTTEQRNEVLEAWNAVEEHDKQPQKFNQLYRTHWGNTLYCRTKRDAC
ncbi:hypothetical protein QTP86_020423, partial [Hemibagrus guttatus]